MTIQTHDLDVCLFSLRALDPNSGLDLARGIKLETLLPSFPNDGVLERNVVSLFATYCDQTACSERSSFQKSSSLSLSLFFNKLTNKTSKWAGFPLAAVTQIRHNFDKVRLRPAYFTEQTERQFFVLYQSRIVFEPRFSLVSRRFTIAGSPLPHTDGQSLPLFHSRHLHFYIYPA